MLRFIQSVIYLLELTFKENKVRLERQHIESKYGHIMSKDDSPLREEMGKMKKIENPSSKIKGDILDLDREITEIMMYRAMQAKGIEKQAEFTALIESVKKHLWN